MKSSIFSGDDGININYIFQKAPVTSNALVVTFPGAPGDFQTGEWGYLVTISKYNCNALFIKTDRQFNYSWLTCINGKPVIENAIKALIDMCAKEVNATQIITIGTSMGGFCALYYGLKYGYDIISGSPPYSLNDPVKIMYAVGGNGKAETDWFNDQIRTIIKNASNRGKNKKLFILYGEGERFWLDADQGQQLFKDLENANINFTYKLYPYSNHVTIAMLFPRILKSRLGYYLGLEDEPQDDAEFEMSPELKLSGYLKESYASLAQSLCELPEDTAPYVLVQNPAHYGNLNPATALRNFVYMEQGWYWGSGFKEPLRMPDKNSFWRILPKNKVAEGLCFWFQDTQLNYYEQSGELKALEWCAENAWQYLEYVNRAADPKHNEHWWNSLRRMHFFMALHKDLSENSLREDLYKDISDEIRRDVELIVSQDIRVEDPQGQYRRTLGLLHAALYFKECAEFYDTFYNTVVAILNESTDFYFDSNGVCIFLQVREHIILTEMLMQNISFIEMNGFPETKALKALKRKYDKIVEFSEHIISPDGIPAALGQSVYAKPPLTLYRIERKTGNYILPNSNIAILNDENNFAYITVNGGSNVHSDYKHCDLLSFTWWYDNVQVFTDSEGAKDPLYEYARSAMAHNGIIVDDQNYVSPSHEDFTTIETVDERDDCVILTMSHNCYHGVTVKRRLMWIKPNIIVLYDEAESDIEHKYTQNFVFQRWKVSRSRFTATVSVAPKFTAAITQIPVDDSDFKLEIFNGTTDVNDEAHYRGSLATGWSRLRMGRNLAYTKYGSKANFLTVIELHGSSDGIAEHENIVSSAKVELDKLAVTLENGTEICEKGVEELRNLISENS